MHLSTHLFTLSRPPDLAALIPAAESVVLHYWPATRDQPVALAHFGGEDACSVIQASDQPYRVALNAADLRTALAAFVEPLDTHARPDGLALVSGNGELMRSALLKPFEAGLTARALLRESVAAHKRPIWKLDGDEVAVMTADRVYYVPVDVLIEELLTEGWH